MFWARPSLRRVRLSAVLRSPLYSTHAGYFASILRAVALLSGCFLSSISIIPLSSFITHNSSHLHNLLRKHRHIVFTYTAIINTISQLIHRNIYRFRYRKPPYNLPHRIKQLSLQFGAVIAHVFYGKIGVG